MAGARKDPRSRGSGDSGDTPSGERVGNDGAGTVASGTVWQTHEVLAAMNDTDFASAVQRAVMSHRKIFVHQERKWAAVRLRENLMPARVAAERARQGLGASGRVRARAKPALAAPAGVAREGLSSRDAPPLVSSVVVRRFRKGKRARGEAGAPAEARQSAPLEALPRADNVPRYTSYQYCADTNAPLHDEVRRQLLYADQEGEMRAASDEEGEESGESDADEETLASPTTPTTESTSNAGNAENTRTQRTQRTQSPGGSGSARRSGSGEDRRRLSRETSRNVLQKNGSIMKKPKMTAAMRAAEKRRKAEEAAAEEAASQDWEPRDDYTLFALVTTLGETSRVLEAVAETMRMSVTTLRARLKRLKGDAAEKPKRTGETGETLAVTFARAEEAVRSGATAAAEYRAAAACVAARARGDAGGVPAEAPAALALVPKHDPEDFDADLDDGRDAPGTGTGTGSETGRPSNLSVARKHAASALARERVATWSLTAWRFLAHWGYAPEEKPEDRGEAETLGSAPSPRERSSVLFDDDVIDEALDSFKTLFCARCHVYDCVLHGCGQIDRAARAYEPAVAERGAFGRPKAPKSEEKEKEKEARSPREVAAAPDANAANDGEPHAPPPCARSCWRLSVDPATLDAPAFDPDCARREAEAYLALKAAPRETRAGWSPERTRWFEDFFRDGTASTNGGVKWTTFESTFFMKLRDAFASEPDARLDPCALARAVGGLTCASVYARLVRDARRGAHFEAARAERAARLDSSSRGADPEDPDFTGDEVLPKAATAGWPRGKKRRRTVYGAKQSSAKKSAWRAIPTTQYRPCECAADPEDPLKKTCGPDCTCASAGNFCEKWCGCGGSCGNSFAGCSCKQGACNTRACPCFAAGRECDPDICKRCAHTAECFAHARRDGWPFEDLCMPVPDPPPAPMAASRARAKPDESCGNMRVLLSQRKHVQLGLSTVAGWGAFLRDGARKNELVGEYTGELITQKEADRRGKIYDKQYGLSFLFNLNDYYVLDAHVRGNKLKFANHSSRAPNCFAKVLMVRGDHRVGIFALRDIEPGEELFFDYCYEKEKAPDWARVDGLPNDAGKTKKQNANAMKARG